MRRNSRAFYGNICLRAFESIIFIFVGAFRGDFGLSENEKRKQQDKRKKKSFFFSMRR